MITISKILSESGRKAVELVVELDSPTIIAVRAGAFRVGSVDLEFLEDQLWELLSPPSVITYVTGYIVREKSTGDLFLLVDNVHMDGEDDTYRFNEGSPYSLLHRLYRFVLPPATASLAGLDISVIHVVKELN